MDDVHVSNYSKEQAAEWLKKIGLSATGSKEELINKIKKYKRCPDLVKRLTIKATRTYTFRSSLDPLTIPSHTSAWKNDERNYPKVNNEIFNSYSAQKREGSAGQQEKAFRMLQSRKIVSVRTFQDEEKLFVKAMIKKSYGQESRPAVILFENNYPTKAHCDYPVGVSGLCCHVLSLLLFLKHFSETSEKIMELTCTQQLQRWHRRSNKGSIPMIPLKDLKLKSGKRRKGNNLSVAAADPGHTYFKRDVTSIIDKLNKDLDKEKPVTEHVYTVLSESKIGRQSSVGQHLCYKFNLNKMGDHEYIERKSFEEKFLNLNSGKLLEIKKYIDREPLHEVDKEHITIENILELDSIPILLEKSITVYDKDDKWYKDLKSDVLKQVSDDDISTVSLDISFLTAPPPSGTNYVEIVQNTDEWQQTRKKKITGSRLASLLGIHGKKKFITMWDVVISGSQEKDLSMIKNIQRGHFYEKDAVKYFEKVSRCITSSCGFFNHPSLDRVGSSPDALGPHGILLEVKTRAENSEGPITSLKSFPQYFIQCQLQMTCTDAHCCILMSYHPESVDANFFVIPSNSLLMDIVMDVCTAIMNNAVLDSWYYGETSSLKLLGKKLLGRKLDFDSLKPLRVYIQKCCKEIKRVNFIDGLDINFFRE